MDIVLFERFVNFAGSAAGLILLLVGVVGWLKSRAEKPQAVEVAQSAPAFRDPDRVVLQFDQKNRDVPGTFEHTIEQFKQHVPPEVQVSLLVSPKALEANQRWVHKTGVYLALMAAAFGVLLVTVVPLLIGLLLTDADIASSFKQEPWLSTLRALIYPVMLLFSWGAAVSSWRSSQSAKETAEVARAYSEFLDRHSISMGYEFTQARAVYDRERGALKEQAA